jgi:hypothetical protein
MVLDWQTIINQGIASPQVRTAIENYGLTEIQEDPPSRRYYINRRRGLSFLAENDRIVDIQIFVQTNKRFSAFPGPIPFGIEVGMTQSQVHELLGVPVETDEFQDKYERIEAGVVLVITYDDSSKVKYISIGLPLS